MTLAMQNTNGRSARNTGSAASGYQLVLQGLRDMGYREEQVEWTAKRIIADVERHAAEKRHLDALERIDDDLDPAAAMALQVTRNTTRQIEQEFGLLTADAVAALLHSTTKTARSLASDLRGAGRVLYVSRMNKKLYPGFQFDSERSRIRPFVSELVSLAAAADIDIEDVSLWMMTPTTFLHGDRPVDHIEAPELLVDVARKAWNPGW